MLWQADSFQLAPGAIVKGKVSKITAFAAFVRLDHGPMAMVHVDHVTRMKFKGLASVLKVFNQHLNSACNYNHRLNMRAGFQPSCAGAAQ